MRLSENIGMLQACMFERGTFLSTITDITTKSPCNYISNPVNLSSMNTPKFDFCCISHSCGEAHYVCNCESISTPQFYHSNLPRRFSLPFSCCTSWSSGAVGLGGILRSTTNCVPLRRLRWVRVFGIVCEYTVTTSLVRCRIWCSFYGRELFAIVIAQWQKERRLILSYLRSSTVAVFNWLIHSARWCRFLDNSSCSIQKMTLSHISLLGRSSRFRKFIHFLFHYGNPSQSPFLFLLLLHIAPKWRSDISIYFLFSMESAYREKL